jgi:hypothetical protein
MTMNDVEATTNAAWQSFNGVGQCSGADGKPAAVCKECADIVQGVNRSVPKKGVVR